MPIDAQIWLGVEKRLVDKLNQVLTRKVNEEKGRTNLVHVLEHQITLGARQICLGSQGIRNPCARLSAVGRDSIPILNLVDGNLWEFLSGTHGRDDGCGQVPEMGSLHHSAKIHTIQEEIHLCCCLFLLHDLNPQPLRFTLLWRLWHQWALGCNQCPC